MCASYAGEVSCTAKYCKLAWISWQGKVGQGKVRCAGLAFPSLNGNSRAAVAALTLSLKRPDQRNGAVPRFLHLNMFGFELSAF